MRSILLCISNQFPHLRVCLVLMLAIAGNDLPAGCCPNSSTRIQLG